MTKKTFRIITGISTAVSTAACSIMALFDAPYLPAVIAIVGIVNGAVSEIASLFVKEE